MTLAARLCLPALALAAACALPSPRAFADGDAPAAPVGPAGQAPSDHDRAVAAVLESANTRMKAKVEEASILDRLGRHDEALAALRAVETIHKEAMAIVDRLTPLGAPIPAAAGSARFFAGGTGRVRPRVTPPLVVEEAPPRYLSDAVAYLLSVQRIDGWFRPIPSVDAPPGADLDEGHDVHTTALAVVALLDSLDDDLKPLRLMNAAIRGVEALLTVQESSGAFGDGSDLEAHALATWALAAGTARLPHAAWRPAAQPAIEKAVAFALSRRDARGLWSADTGSTDDDWIVSAWMATALHEVHALPRSFARDVDLGVVLHRVQLGAHEAWMGGVAATSPAARFARALLLAEKSPEESGVLPTSADDDVALLFGTTLRFGRSCGFEAWQDEVLTASQRQQRRSGPLSGSWEPAGARALRHGRTYATACRLLAALVPLVPYREPAD